MVPPFKPIVIDNFSHWFYPASVVISHSPFASLDRAFFHDQEDTKTLKKSHSSGNIRAGKHEHLHSVRNTCQMAVPGFERLVWQPKGRGWIQPARNSAGWDWWFMASEFSLGGTRWERKHHSSLVSIGHEPSVPALFSRRLNSFPPLR